MTPPPIYESLLVKIDDYSDFKLAPASTDGRIERYLKDYDFPITHVRFFLFLILCSIPISTVGLFYLNHPSVDYFNNHSIERLQFQQLILDSEIQGRRIIEQSDLEREATASEDQQ